ncbi:hypothetical protein B0H14DRAFT_2577699 [Mycena olivaceomarginata]|nr:hypothetical protein B0H14DRAFT_2577699 [Mycena olivaceomarginata]
MTVSMKSSVTGRLLPPLLLLGLVLHLKTFPAQHRLFQILLEQSKLTEDQDTEPTDKEIAFTSGARPYGKNEEAGYLKRLRKQTMKQASSIRGFAQSHPERPDGYFGMQCWVATSSGGSFQWQQYDVVDDRIKEVLGRNTPDWRLKNCCTVFVNEPHALGDGGKAEGWIWQNGYYTSLSAAKEAEYVLDYRAQLHQAHTDMEQWQEVEILGQGFHHPVQELHKMETV